MVLNELMIVVNKAESRPTLATAPVKGSGIIVDVDAVGASDDRKRPRVRMKFILAGKGKELFQGIVAAVREADSGVFTCDKIKEVIDKAVRQCLDDGSRENNFLS